MTAPITADLLIVIVNYRSAELTLDCLASLEPEIAARGATHVAVVENASGADQWDRLNAEIGRRGWAAWVSLIAAERNGGFAAGNNVALRWALSWPNPPQVFWLLNPDTIVRPGALAALVAPLAERPEVGIVGGHLEDARGGAQHATFRFPSILSEIEASVRLGLVTRLLRNRSVLRDEPAGPGPVDWVSGASLLVRKAVLDRVGLLDEGFFMYFEEVDLCHRARAAGWLCWYTPAARVVHLEGQSSPGVARPLTERRQPRYWFEARNRYFVKNYGTSRTWLINTMAWTASATYHLRRRVQGRLVDDYKGILWDFLRYSVLAVRR